MGANNHSTTVPNSNTEQNANPECRYCGKKMNAAWNYCPRCGEEASINSRDGGDGLII